MEFANIKAITFDAGGTLIEPCPSVGHIYSAVAAELGYGAVSPDKLNAAFAKAWKVKESFDYSLSAWFILVEQVFAPYLPHPLAPKLFEALYQRFTQTAAWHVYDDVQPTLAALRQRGYRLGVVSNWDDRLKMLLSDLQLSRYFDAIVLSVDVGATKPSSQIFAHTLNLLNLPASSVLHIGDSIEEDLIGPERSDIPALLLERTGPSDAPTLRRSDAPRSTGSLSSLTDLLSLLPGANLRAGRSG